MIPDRTQLNTLYIKTDDGEYQELGKTTSLEYACDVASLPTLNLELRCTYEQSKKEKEVKEMSYDELVKKLPKIEIDGVPIEYGKTKVIFNEFGEDYEGVIVYNDNVYGQPLLFKYDVPNGYGLNLDNITLSIVPCDDERILKNHFSSDDMYDWISINELTISKEELKKTELHIDNNGIPLAYEPFNYVSYDTSLIKDYYNKVYLTKDFCEKSCLGMWNTEEEKERGNKMELINIYKEKSLENINKYFEKEEKDYLESNEIRKKFEAIVNEANEKIKKLYESQNLFEETLYKIMEQSQTDYNINYTLSQNIMDSGITNIREKHTKINNELYETLNEVQAQIECIEDHSENEYEEIMRVLKNYGIVDEKGKVTPYQIKKLHLHNDLDDDNNTKRGRKPKKSE